jgi:hypothetical protein
LLEFLLGEVLLALVLFGVEDGLLLLLLLLFWDLELDLVLGFSQPFQQPLQLSFIILLPLIDWCLNPLANRLKLLFLLPILNRPQKLQPFSNILIVEFAVVQGEVDAGG